jgi:hypothetical protein
MDVPFEGVTPLRVDLLDANESTWAFALVEHVGGAGKLHVTWLVTLASDERCRNYCGRTADGPVGEQVGCTDGSWCSDHPNAVHRTRQLGHRTRGKTWRLAETQFRTVHKPSPAPSWHCLGPRDMSFEAKRSRHVAVAIPVFAIAGIVTMSPRQKSTESQQPDVEHHETLIGWRRR